MSKGWIYSQQGEKRPKFSTKAPDLATKVGGHLLSPGYKQHGFR